MSKFEQATHFLEKRVTAKKEAEKSEVGLEGKLREQVDGFSKEVLSCKLFGEETFSFATMAKDGARELIQIYGSEKFIDAFEQTKSASEKEGGVVFNMYTLICKLEGDAKKRSELYGQMKEALESESKKFEEAAGETGEKFDENYTFDFGPNQGMVNAAKSRIEVFQTLDKLQSNPIFRRIFSSKPKLFAKIDRLEPIEISDQLKDDLKKNEGNFDRTVAQRYGARDAQKEALFQKANEMRGAIEIEINAINAEVSAEKTKATDTILRDVEKLNNLGLEEEMMARSIQELLSKAEERIGRVESDAARKSQQKTQKLVKMLEDIQSGISSLMR